MKDLKDLMEYILKNKYVIMCVAIIVLLYALGVVDFITKFIVLLVLIAAAIYVGKKLQDNESTLKKIFRFRGSRDDDNVYYYQEKNDSNDKK